jgi:tRNA-2-methylthio-N6-dimethylallyladenosine synthase
VFAAQGTGAADGGPRLGEPVNGERRFHIRTYGCQMNVHDSEKVANLLHHAGLVATDDTEDADLLIVNTCSIREKAENRLYTDLGLLREWKQARESRVIGVAGCVAQQEGDRILRRFRHVDFVYGTHNLRFVPEMALAAERGQRSVRTEETRSLDRFDLPERHPDFGGTVPGRAYLTVMEGCDMFCSFCVVPGTRGREISRPAVSIVAEAASLAARGVREVTLLGQTVNAYGRHDVRRNKTAEAGTIGFAALLGELDRVPGLEWVRYTSPHPLFFDDALVRAHAELEVLCPHVHLPLQSGSDRVLERMRRRYTAAEYRKIVEALRHARPDLALTSDLIVGFPGETDADFRETLSLVRDCGFVDSFSFKYSPRPNTRAAEFEDAVDPGLAQDRLAELQELQRSQTLTYHRSRVGEEAWVRVEGPSRRGGDQLYGRDRYHRSVNFAAPADSVPAPGERVQLRIVEATPHSLIGSCEIDPAGLAPVKPGSGNADDFKRSAVAGS